MAERTEPTAEQIAEARKKMASLIEQTNPFLQKLALAADQSDTDAWFQNYQEILKIWSDADDLKAGTLAPPWAIGSSQIQFIILHTGFALFARVLNDTGLFAALKQANQMKKASGLVDPRGQPII